MKLSPILPLAAFAITGVSAAPTRRSLDCKPHGKPSALLFVPPDTPGEPPRTLYFAGNVESGRATMAWNRDSNEHFQFFSCEAPSDKFRTSGDGIFGQVRSVDNPDYCLTPGDVVPHGVDKVDADEEGHYNTVQLKPCASKDSKTARLQWFNGVRRGDRLRIAQVGYKGDQVRRSPEPMGPHDHTMLFVKDDGDQYMELDL